MRIPIAPVLSRWRRSSLAETDASDLASAACYRRPEHVGIAAVVVPELKLRDVERHVFSAHLMERADNAAFEDRPETFNRVRVHRADNILVRFVINHLVQLADNRPKSSKHKYNHRVGEVYARYLARYRKDPDQGSAGYNREIRPPQYLIDQRDARSNLPRTINMMLLGDPIPGRSALDQKCRT